MLITKEVAEEFKQMIGTMGSCSLDWKLFDAAAIKTISSCFAEPVFASQNFTTGLMTGLVLSTLLMRKQNANV